MPDGVAIHYSAADADEQANHANCAGRVRGIQNFHMDDRGWCDVAYSFLVCAHGYVYEGRGFAKRTAAQGTNHGNDRYLAVCVLANDDRDELELNAAVRQGLIDIRRAILERHPRGRETKGHRDFNNTPCPGDEIYRWVTSPAFEAAVFGEPALPGPVPKPDWFWVWADWRRRLAIARKRGLPRPPRPEGLRRVIPPWAWLALREFNRLHPIP